MKFIREIAAIVALSSVVFVGTSVGACSSAPTQDIEGVLYRGTATDEALTAMLLAQGTSDPTQAVVVDTPSESAILPKDVLPTITWHVAGASASRGTPKGTTLGKAASSLLSWLGPREAWAHGGLVNGRAYYLVFSTPNNPGILRVFTTHLFFEFDATSWSKLAGTGEPITIEVTNAIFEDNSVADSGGPFVGTERSFSIEP